MMLKKLNITYSSSNLGDVAAFNLRNPINLSLRGIQGNEVTVYGRGGSSRDMPEGLDDKRYAFGASEIGHVHLTHNKR
jgi:hypothetical protein